MVRANAGPRLKTRTPNARLDKLEALMVDKLGLARDDLRFIAAMLSIPFHDRYGAILISPKLAREDTMRTLVEVVRAQARSEPTLVLFEDAHWADPSTLDVFARIVDKLADIPALVVVTARPEFKPPWKPGPGVSDIQLAKFTPMQSRSLLEKVAGGKALPDGLAAQIIARTDGVPLFVEELTKTILELGDLIVEGDHFAYAGSAANVSIPETLRELADGSPRSRAGGEGDRPGRFGHRPRIHVRADRRPRSDERGIARHGAQTS